MSRQRTPEEFWGLLEKRGNCLVWPRHTNRGGYGVVKYQGTQYRTHRLAYILKNGPIPKGMHVLHRCDNPPCCNPEHLFLGSDADNVADAIAKGRFSPGKSTHRRAQGEQCARSRLTAEQVREIRKRCAEGTGGIRCLAKEYGVRHYTIWCIVTGRTWRHIAEEAQPA